MSDGTGNPHVASVVANRYTDAYIVARTINGVGITIKGIGIAIGAVLGLISLVAASQGSAGVVLGLMGLAVASAIAAMFFLLGTLASAQGQILKATLDTAVNTSSFLTDHDRSRIMSLPVGASTSANSFVPPVPLAPQGEWRCRCGQLNPVSTSACLDCGVQFGA